MSWPQDQFLIKRGDVLPVIRSTLTQGPDSVPPEERTPIDLTQATEVRLRLRSEDAPAGSPPLIDQVATIENPRTAGVVRYDWQAGDTNHESGLYVVEWRISWPTGPQTVPNDGFVTVNITPVV